MFGELACFKRHVSWQGSYWRWNSHLVWLLTCYSLKFIFTMRCDVMLHVSSYRIRSPPVIVMWRQRVFHVSADRWCTDTVAYMDDVEPIALLLVLIWKRESTPVQLTCAIISRWRREIRAQFVSKSSTHADQWLTVHDLVPSLCWMVCGRSLSKQKVYVLPIR